MSLYDDLFKRFEEKFKGQPVELKMIYQDSFEVIIQEDSVGEDTLNEIREVFEEYEPNLIGISIHNDYHLWLDFSANIGFDEEYDSDFLDKSEFDYSRGGGNDPSL